MRGNPEEDSGPHDYDDDFFAYLFSMWGLFPQQRVNKQDPRRRVQRFGGRGEKCSACGERKRALKQFTKRDQAEGVGFCDISCWGSYRGGRR